MLANSPPAGISSDGTNSSVLLLGQSLGWRTGDTLSRAQDFASAIVGVRGATVEPGFYQPFLADWKLR